MDLGIRHGWKIVTYTKNSYILAGMKEENPSELYFGEKEEREFQLISKKIVWFWMCLIAVWLFLWINMICMSRIGFHVNWMWIFESDILEMISPFIYIMIGMYTTIMPYFRQRKYIKEVKLKGTEAHHVAWKGRIIRRNVEIGTMLLLLVLICTGIILSFRGEDMSESEAKIKYPFIESGVPDRNMVGQEYESYVYDKSSIFCKTNCSFIQCYTRKEEERRIEQQYYELRFSWHKDRFMKAVLQEKADLLEGERIKEPERLFSTEFDTIYYSPEKGQTRAYQLIASKDKQILYIRYDGGLSKEEVVKRMEQELN